MLDGAVLARLRDNGRHCQESSTSTGVQIEDVGNSMSCTPRLQELGCCKPLGCAAPGRPFKQGCVSLAFDGGSFQLIGDILKICDHT